MELIAPLATERDRPRPDLRRLLGAAEVGQDAFEQNQRNDECFIRRVADGFRQPRRFEKSVAGLGSAIESEEDARPADDEPRLQRRRVAGLDQLFGLFDKDPRAREVGHPVEGRGSVEHDLDFRNAIAALFRQRSSGLEVGERILVAAGPVAHAAAAPPSGKPALVVALLE